MPEANDSFYEDDEAPEEPKLSLVARIKSMFVKPKAEEPKEDLGFYGAKDDDDDKEYAEAYDDDVPDKRKKARKADFKSFTTFTWWEIIVLVVEFFLIIYTVLVFLGVVPIF